MLTLTLDCGCRVPIWAGSEATLPRGLELAERVVAAQDRHRTEGCRR